MINRRGFIALSAAALASLPLVGLQEVWFHRGTPVTVRRDGKKVKMWFKINGQPLGLGAILSDDRPSMERLLRRSIALQIDKETGYTDRWLKDRFNPYLTLPGQIGAVA